MERILLLLTHEDERLLLRERLGPGYQAVGDARPPGQDEDFDLAIIDEHADPATCQWLDGRRRAEEPVFLPILLMSPHLTVRTGAARLGCTIDEIIRPPVEEDVLDARLASLLRERRLSRELHERYRRLFDGVPLGLYRASTTGQILDANASLARMLHYPDKASLLATELSDLHADAGEYRRWQTWMDRQGAVNDFEVQLRRKNGSAIHAVSNAQVVRDGAGRPLHYEGSLEDITARKQAEWSVKQRQEALESIYHIVTTRPHSLESNCDQVVTDIAKLLRVPCVLAARRDGAVLKTISKIADGRLSHGDTCPVDETPLQRVIESGETVQRSGSPCEHFPGSLWLQERENRSYVAVPVRDSNGHVAGVLCALDDHERTFTDDEVHLIEIFADYVAHENEREVREHQLRELEQMRVGGQIASGVAHEVRNPLNAILAITEALSQDIGHQPDFEPYLHHMRTQVNRLSDLMNDLLSLGRPLDTSSLRLVTLPDVCANVLDLWRQSMLHKATAVRLVLPADTERLHVLADPARLQQVFLNLLDNAAQHSKPGSDISLVVCPASARLLRVRVRDHGCGIAPDVMPRIFDPFFTNRSKGTGLGLCIVRNIVERHGGSVAVWNNDPPPGCTVEVRFPQAGSDTP